MRHIGREANRNAFKILKANKDQFVQIAKNTFEEYIADCNKLKTSNLKQQQKICDLNIYIR